MTRDLGRTLLVAGLITSLGALAGAPSPNVVSYVDPPSVTSQAVTQGGSAGVLMAMPQISHNVVIKASRKGKRLFGICSHWTSANISTYSCDGKWGSLHPGQNSRDKYRWRDTDAVQVTRGFTLMLDSPGNDQDVALAGCRERTFYKKISADLLRAIQGKTTYKTVYLKKCQKYA